MKIEKIIFLKIILMSRNRSRRDSQDGRHDSHFLVIINGMRNIFRKIVETHPFQLYVFVKNLLDLAHFQHRIILIYVPFQNNVFMHL